MFVCVIVVTTRKVAVISGSAATFNCTINAPKYDVCWTHKNVLSRNHNDLYVKGELTPTVPSTPLSMMCVGLIKTFCQEITTTCMLKEN